MAADNRRSIHLYDGPSIQVDGSAASARETSGWDLTAFERRALELFAGGMPRREIAHQLNRAPKTISNSLTAARDKLGARSLAEAAALIAAETVSLSLRASS